MIGKVQNLPPKLLLDPRTRSLTWLLWLQLVFTVALAIIFDFGQMIGELSQMIGTALGLAAVAINCAVIFLFLIVALFKNIAIELRHQPYKKTPVKKLVLAFIAVGLPIVVIPNIWELDFKATSVAARLMEPSFLQQVQRLPPSSIKYHRFSFGHISNNRRWIIYDESEQVLLDRHNRSKDWWAISGEAEEFEGCLTDARRIHGHFFIRYSGC